MRIHLDISGGEASLALAASGDPSLALSGDYVGDPLPDYGGPYEVTPTDAAQVLPTASTRLSRDITVGAIPSNWGRIAWNGSVLTVS